MPLTPRQVKGFSYNPNGKSVQILWDTDRIPGFGVRVFESGKKSFVLWYTTKGRQRLMTLGQYESGSKPLTLDKARKEAQLVLDSVRAGSDPIGDREREREAVTLRQFAETYIEQHAKRRKKTWREDRRRLDTYVIPSLGHHKLASVSRADVSRLHNKLGESKPYEANRVLALISTLFSQAQQLGYLPEQATNPTRLVKPFPERSRERYVTAAEMPAVFAAIEQEPNPYVRAAFKLYLFTGLRRAELLGLRWRDVDLAERRLRLPDTKAGRPHTLPLSAPAVEILRELPRMLGNPYVLAGESRGKPLVNVTRPWRRIRARVWLVTNPQEATKLRAQAESEIRARKSDSKHGSDRESVIEARVLALADRHSEEDAIRIHDLRRTTGSWLAMAGASLPLIGKVLNHSNASTTQIYARLAEDAPRAALDALAEKMIATKY
jgi:integrase